MAYHKRLLGNTREFITLKTAIKERFVCIFPGSLQCPEVICGVLRFSVIPKKKSEQQITTKRSG